MNLRICAIQRMKGKGMGKTKDLSAFEQSNVVPDALVGVCQKVFHTQQFPVCIKYGPQSKRHPANLTQLWEALESTWASIPIECFRHLVESISRRI